jgi:hypothetical protein
MTNTGNSNRTSGSSMAGTPEVTAVYTEKVEISKYFWGNKRRIE